MFHAAGMGKNRVCCIQDILKQFQGQKMIFTTAKPIEIEQIQYFMLLFEFRINAVKIFLMQTPSPGTHDEIPGAVCLCVKKRNIFFYLNRKLRNFVGL